MSDKLIGKVFGRLTVTGFNSFFKSNGWGAYVWDCTCECGNTTTALTSELKRGRKKSCGCLQKAIAATTGKKMFYKHGLSKNPDGTKTRLFRIWTGIKTRCYNKKAREYPQYGGRGISVCNEWVFDFKCFHQWALANGYNDELTIERDEVDGNYEPNNCRWIPLADQANNRTTSRFFIVNGDRFTLAQMAKKYNISIQVLHGRLKRGKTIEQCNKPVDKRYYKKTD